ncbi:hypothetical protein V6N13_060609 [Hibiscus sabdariffa]|uniref:Uncharacterized protein n=1 Tax=Hibiscus sabdariffa TaxID=183260 RepID=A0ABR2P7C0_9ROSI
MAIFINNRDHRNRYFFNPKIIIQIIPTEASQSMSCPVPTPTNMGKMAATKPTDESFGIMDERSDNRLIIEGRDKLLNK